MALKFQVSVTCTVESYMRLYEKDRSLNRRKTVVLIFA